MIKKLLCLVFLLFCFQSAFAQETATNSKGDMAVEDQLSFYPNPAKDEIKVTNSSGEQIALSVFNILGDEVLKTQLSEVETDLSLENLPSGIYIIAFYHNDKTITERLIKE